MFKRKCVIFSLLGGVVFSGCGTQQCPPEAPAPLDTSDDQGLDAVTKPWDQIYDQIVGWCQLEYHGAFVGCGEHKAFRDGMACFVREGSYLMVYEQNDSNYTLYAKIEADGNLRYVPSDKATLPEQSAQPRSWQHVSKDGVPIPPSPTDVLIGERLKSFKPEPPDGTLGWLYLTRGGDFSGHPDGMDPFPNVLWVVKDGQGLEIRHAGPAFEGRYASVNPNRTIVFEAIPESLAFQAVKDSKWMIVGEDGLPRFTSGEFLMPAHLQLPFEITVHGDGTTSMPNIAPPEF